MTTPEQQKAAADAARKDNQEQTDKETKKDTPIPEPIAGSKTGMQAAPTSPNLNDNSIKKVS